jgi:hypothetical protein
MPVMVTIDTRCCLSNRKDEWKMRNTLTVIAIALWPIIAGAQEATRSPLGPAGTVTLSRAEYDRLLDLVNRKPLPPDQAPVAAALTRADIRVRVDGATARATMQVEGEAFRSGVAKVPLIKGAVLLDAQSANRPLPLITEGDLHLAVVPGPATFAATLEVGTPLVFSPGRGAFVLPVPIAGTATATIDVPGDQTDVHLTNGIVLRRSSANARTIVEATLDPGRPTEVWWSTRDSAPTPASARDVRLLSEVKTLVTIGDADVRLVTLLDITIVQGEPTQIEVSLPAGYEVSSVSGASLERTEMQGNRVMLLVTDPALRRHQFLISLERQNNGGSFKLNTGFPTIAAARRETGEVAIEGVGTLEVVASDVPGLRRMDVREVDSALASAARQALLAAYRYQRTSDVPPSLALEVRRFPDAAVLAAVAERAVATTLVTSEGRALTEVTLWMRNRAQPFMKVALPQGASMLSVEVGGAPAKPVEGKDGSRVPLLRPGFRPDGMYVVSFVYLNAGMPFAKKGDMQMMLPKMDVPVNVLEWELFVPDQYRVDRFEGSMLAAELLERSGVMVASMSGGSGGGLGAGSGSGVGASVRSGVVASTGQIVGRLVDQSGAALPGATVTAEGAGQKQVVTTDVNGLFTLSGVPSGSIVVTGQLQGFRSVRQTVGFDQRPRRVDMTLLVGPLTEAIEVTAEAPVINTRTSEGGQTFTTDELRPQSKARADNEPSVNVQNLQRRASGVLPVRMNVPRAGTSHRFVKPLVIDEPTVVTFRYKRR